MSYKVKLEVTEKTGEVRKYCLGSGGHLMPFAEKFAFCFKNMNTAYGRAKKIVDLLSKNERECKIIIIKK